MTHESLLNELWQTTLTRLGGTAAIEASAREKGAFLRSRAVVCATDLLRLVLAYCLGGMGLRPASAWAASAGLADLSNVALLKPEGGASGSSTGQLFRKLGKRQRKTVAYGGFIALSTSRRNVSVLSS